MGARTCVLRLRVDVESDGGGSTELPELAFITATESRARNRSTVSSGADDDDDHQERRNKAAQLRLVNVAHVLPNYLRVLRVGSKQSSGCYPRQPTH